MTVVSNDIVTTIPHDRRIPVDKSLAICYNCAMEQYCDSRYNGKRHTQCIMEGCFAEIKIEYDETRRETCCCRYFRRRRPLLTPQYAKKGGEA